MDVLLIVVSCEHCASCVMYNDAEGGERKERVGSTGCQAFQRHQHRSDCAATSKHHQGGNTEDGQRHHEQGGY